MTAILQLSLISLLALYVAWNLGANDVANSMGTSVGSKALTLKQALIVAGILEFVGAVLFSQGVSDTLATKVVNPSLFAQTPQLLLIGMVSVLLTCGLWLQIATRQGLPVASSHAVVGAIAGFSWVAVGGAAVDWAIVGRISLAWVVTPVISGVVAALFYSQIRLWVFEQPNPLVQIQEWIPWLSAILVGVFGVVVLPTFFSKPIFATIPITAANLSLATGAIAAVGISLSGWGELERLRQTMLDLDHKQVLERLLGKFQVISACFVAFAHGSNDVGNAIAPLAAIVYILRTGSVPVYGLNIPNWILVLGGLGIVAGLAVQGKQVITTVGEEIISLQPSGGFCAEIATATTILLASRFGLPVSTSHALVGSVVGIGLVQKQNVRFQTVKAVIIAWVVTLPITAIIGAFVFILLRWLFI